MCVVITLTYVLHKQVREVKQKDRYMGSEEEGQSSKEA